MTRKKWTIIVLLFLLLIPSAVLAQEDLPPVDIANTLDSGMLAVVVLIVMLEERLLGKILPYITKSNGNKGDDATKTIKILCDQLRNIDTVNKDTNVMVKELHGWHNVPDPKSGRMIWSGLGIANLQETMQAINRNIEAQTLATKEHTRALTQMSQENIVAHATLMKELQDKT